VDADAPAPEAALAARAAATPETPFLFFRGPRGSFTWWSWQRASAESGAPGGDEAEAGGAASARDYLGRLRRLAPADAAAGAALLAILPPAPERPIWLTRGGLERPVDRAVAAVALAAGWAIVHEPGAEIHPATFAWARPTILAGSHDELLALLAGYEALAPPWRRSAWLARRTARLRALVLGPGEQGGALAARARALGARAAVLSIPGSGW